MNSGTERETETDMSGKHDTTNSEVTMATTSDDADLSVATETCEGHEIMSVMSVDADVKLPNKAEGDSIGKTLTRDIQNSDTEDLNSDNCDNGQLRSAQNAQIANVHDKNVDSETNGKCLKGTDNNSLIPNAEQAVVVEEEHLDERSLPSIANDITEHMEHTPTEENKIGDLVSESERVVITHETGKSVQGIETTTADSEYGKENCDTNADKNNTDDNICCNDKQKCDNDDDESCENAKEVFHEHDPFPSLESLCVSETKIQRWRHLEVLKEFPALASVRMKVNRNYVAPASLSHKYMYGSDVVKQLQNQCKNNVNSL